MSWLFGRPDGSSRPGRARFVPLGFLALALVSCESPAREKAASLGARRSEELAFEEADTADEDEYSEILWKALKGADSPMPPPVRSAFVLPRR